MWLDNLSCFHIKFLMQSVSQVSALMARTYFLSLYSLRKMTLNDCVDFAGVVRLGSKLTVDLVSLILLGALGIRI